MTPDLALAVSKAGGIGSLRRGLHAARSTLREYASSYAFAQRLTHRSHVNFITCFENDAQVRVCAEERVPIVSWHWGHPSQAHRQLLRDAGVAYWEQVGSIDDARRGKPSCCRSPRWWSPRVRGRRATASRACPTSRGYRRWPCCTMIVDAVGKDAMGARHAGGISDGPWSRRGPRARRRCRVGRHAHGGNPGGRAVHDEHKVRMLSRARGEDTVFSSIFGPE